MNRLERLPVPILPTFVGVATLGNVYNGLGYPIIRHISILAAAFVLLIYILKICKFPDVVIKEYKMVIPSSLYAGYSMITMILGSYVYDFSPGIGKFLWALGLTIHACHILVFTYRNVIKTRVVDTFVPTWFVTYNGIMVSCVIGGAMNEPAILTVVTYYGIAIYFILIPLLIYRLIKVELKPAMLHTMAVVLAPCSLCVVSYLNVIENPNSTLLYILYACVLASVAFIIIKLPKFFSVDFNPGFAALTFPMAIGVVASTKMVAYFAGLGNESLASTFTQVMGIQLYLTTMIIGYVVLNFIIMTLRLKKK